MKAGTVEFIVDQDAQSFYFLEMNTRIQVEHPVTEVITGVDLVQAQFRIAAGQPLFFTQDDLAFTGHAIECRITAELPHQGFRPNPGRIEAWEPPAGPGIRLDTHCHAGYSVPMFYDSLLAKLIVHGRDRADALGRMQDALRRFRIDGIGTTIPFLRHAMSDADFAAGRVNTRLVEEMIGRMPLDPIEPKTGQGRGTPAEPSPPPREGTPP
jgi:acetyl-CoA carboxylase, biotin carboxylase subunit